MNLIYDNGAGFVIESELYVPSDEDMAVMAESDWVTQQLDQTAKPALEPDYPVLTQVLAYRAALRAYRDNNYEGDRPQLEV